MLYVKTDIQICKGTATTCDSNKVYLGEFKKQRYYDHVKFFRNEFYGNNTTLSSYIWEIKKKKKNVTPRTTYKLRKHILT